MSAYERGLLDTSVVVSLGGLTDSDELPVRCFVSAITLAELSAAPLVAKSDPERVARQSVLHRSRRTFTGSRSTTGLPARSDESRRNCVRPAAS